MSSSEIRKFQHEAGEVADFLKQHFSGECVKITAHTDPDGVSAAAIIAKCLNTYDVPFRLTFTRPLKSKEITEMAKESHDLFIFVDQGSNQLPAIHKFLLGKGRKVVVLDHHPGEFMAHPNLIHLNPHMFGLDGAKDISAAGVTYLVAENIDNRFRQAIWLALVGAIGDRQESLAGFTGINEVLLKRAIDLGFIEMNNGLKLIGRNGPLSEALRLSIKPYLRGISGETSAGRSLIEELGFSPTASLEELGQEAELKLRDALFARSGSLAEDEKFCHSLWGPVYKLRPDLVACPCDLGEYVVMLDACDKLKKPALGFAVAAGDKKAQTDTSALLKDYQERMTKVLKWIATHLDQFNTFSEFRCAEVGDAVEPSMMGEALSLAMESGFLPTDLPVIGLVDAGSETKVSARATPELAMRGVDVGAALMKAAAAVEGEGGGHNVSASALIPRGREDVFMAKLKEFLPPLR